MIPPEKIRFKQYPYKSLPVSCSLERDSTLATAPLLMEPVTLLAPPPLLVSFFAFGVVVLGTMKTMKSPLDNELCPRFETSCAQIKEMII